MTKKVLLEVILIVILVGTTNALSETTQVRITGSDMVQVEWEKIFGRQFEDFGRALLNDANGDLVLVANTENFGLIFNNVMVLKLDSNGNELWNVTFGTQGDDIPTAIVQADDGGYFISGTSTIAGNQTGLFAKVSKSGELIWNKSLGTSENNKIDSLIKTKDGGLLLVGVTTSFSTDPDMWLIKTDKDGTEEWNKTYDGASAQRAFDVVNTKDGGYAMVGWTGANGDTDVYLLKTDKDGTLLFNISFGRMGSSDFAEEIVETPDGELILGGITDSITLSTGSNDAWIIKTDSNGVEEWNHTYGGAGNDYVNALLNTEDKGILVTLHTFSYGFTSGDNMVLKINGTNGETEWNWTIGYAARDDFAYDMIELADGGYVMTGITESVGAGGGDIWVLKITIGGKPASSPGYTMMMTVGVIIPIIYLRKKKKR